MGMRTIEITDENHTWPPFTYLRPVAGCTEGLSDSVEEGNTLLIWVGETARRGQPDLVLCALPMYDYGPCPEDSDMWTRAEAGEPAKPGKHGVFVQFFNSHVVGTFEVIDDLDEIERLLALVPEPSP